MPVPARRLAAELMNTIAAPGSSTGSAAAATRKCARALIANVSSHCATLVPAVPRPSPIPTFSTSPSSPPSAAADSLTTDAHASGRATSAGTTAARCPSPRTRAAVTSAAAASRSAQATAAPSRAASTEMARPFPIGGSGSGDGRVPAPTTSTRRPVSRSRPGAVPRNSAPRYSGIGPHRRGAGRQRHVERVEQERDQRVVPAQRHQLDHPGIAEDGVRGVVGGTVDPAMNTELPRHRVHGPLVVRLERRFLAAADGVHDGAGHAVLACHRRVREPLELRLPPRPDRDDRDLGQPPLDRGVEPQRRAERGEPPPGARRGDERVERPGQAALGGHQQAAPAVQDGVPQLLALGPELPPAHIRKTGHRLATAGALVNTRFSVSIGPRYSAVSLK